MRAVRSVAVALALAGVLSGCAQEQQERYCEAVEANQARLGEIVSEGRWDAMIQARPVFEDLAGEAPADIRDEWRTVLEAVRGFEQAVSAADVDLSDYDPEDPPESVTEEEQAEIERAVRQLVAPDTAEALGGLEQQARDVCHTPLEL